MYNITIIGEDGGTNIVSIDNLEKSTYKNINIIPKDFLINAGGYDMLAWVGDNSPENLEVSIDKKSLELIKESGQGIFNGLIGLDLDKFAHFYTSLSTGDFHLIDACEESISGYYNVMLDSYGISFKVYCNVRPKYIGFPLIVFFENILGDSMTNGNDFSDVCYWLDLSNLKNSAGNVVDFSNFTLFLYIGDNNAIHLPLFLDNKELTLSPVPATEINEEVPDEYKNVKITARKHFNNLNSLENGIMMFMGCSKLKDFPYELPKLSQSALMFAYVVLKSLKLIYRLSKMQHLLPCKQ